MNSIGETLRRERVRLGLDLDQIAEQTKIGTRLLRAMEADQFEKLPGGVFTRSFIKQYARVLGLDEEAIGAEYKSLQQKQEESPPVHQGFQSQTYLPSIAPDNGSRIRTLDPQSRSRLVSAGWVTAAAGVCVAGYFFMNQQHALQNPTPSEPSAVAETASNPGEPSAPVGTTPAAVETRQPQARPVVSNPSGGVQVLLKASGDSWLSVTADGQNKFSGVLKANETRQIDANEKVKVTAGNSGALDISLNGKSIGPIGGAGQIRTVEFTPEGAHVVPRTPPSNPDPLL